MAAQQQTQSFIASDVLGDTLPSQKAAGCALGGKDVGFLRQRVIVHLLEQVPMDPATLYATCTRLVQSGVLTHEAVPELRGLAVEADSGGGKPMPQLEEAPYPGSPLHGLPSRFEQDFERLELLGRGAFGEVWRCRHRLDGREYAVKAVQYRTSAGDAGEVERRVLREASTWAGMSHPNIARYHCAWVEVKCTSLAQAVSLDSIASCSASEDGDSDSESDDGGVIFSPAAGLGGVERAVLSKQAAGSKSEARTDGSATTTASDGLGVVAQSAEPSSTEQPPAVVGRRLPTYQAVLYIQAELCAKDTLMSWISQRNAAMASPLYTQEDHCRWAARAADIFHQCAVALEHLHAKNVAHRDVKPSNILFGRDGAVRLGDFGLAKVLDGPLSLEDKVSGSAEGTTSSAATRTRAAGTPSYASPEQLAGGPCGVETDVYALGMILAELLCPVRTQMERATMLEGLRRDRKVPDEVTAAFPAAACLAVAMTHPDPLQRPTIPDLLKAYPDVVREVQQRLGSDVLLDVETRGCAVHTAAVKEWAHPQSAEGEEEHSSSACPSGTTVNTVDGSAPAPAPWGAPMRRQSCQHAAGVPPVRPGQRRVHSAGAAPAPLPQGQLAMGRCAS